MDLHNPISHLQLSRRSRRRKIKKLMAVKRLQKNHTNLPPLLHLHIDCLLPSLKVQLLIYFMLKYAMEVLLSESSVVTSFYFNWTASKVALFLACLGFTVLPVNIVVGTYISNIFEERQLLLASEILVLIGTIMSFNIAISYSVPQYVSSALSLCLCGSSGRGESVASLASHVIKARLARETYNGGLPRLSWILFHAEARSDLK